MEYISVEEFLKQDKEVQEVFKKWWQPKEGDLYASGYYLKDDYETIHYGTRCIEYDMYRDMKEDEEWTIKEYVFQYASDIPLLTEGQLRKFIEYKKQCKIDIQNRDDATYLYLYDLNALEGMYLEEYPIGPIDLLQAYWKVAVQIAREVENNAVV